MSSRQPGRSSTSSPTSSISAASMSDEPKRRERQTALRKSDHCVVPVKPGNSGGGKAVKPIACEKGTPAALSGGDPVEARLARITVRAREHPREVLTNLAHHLDHELLRE